MSPRTEFVCLSILVASIVQMGVVLLLAAARHSVARDISTALPMMPAALLAAGVGAWLVAHWQARASSNGRHWKAVGMTLRTVLVALLLFPVALAVWVLVVQGIDQVTADAPGSLGDSLIWLPVIMFYGSLAALVCGAVPAFFLEYFACRRYLRRQAVPFLGHA